MDRQYVNLLVCGSAELCLLIGLDPIPACAAPPEVGTQTDVGPVQVAETTPDREPQIDAEAGCTTRFDWSNVPPVEPFPRRGGFLIPPTGPGYYSLYDWLIGDYLNRFVKVQFNYEHAWFDNPVKLGSSTANLVRSDDAVLARFQFNF